MKKLRFCVALVSLLFIAGCESDNIVERQSFVFGTLVEVIVYGASDNRANRAIDEVMHDFDYLHHKFHPWSKSAGSELVLLNEHIAAGKPFKVSADMALMIRDMQYYERITQGFFNTAIGRLVDLWGFHSSHFTPHLPAPGDIKFLISQKPSAQDLVIDNQGYVRSSNRFVSLDDGGYAKGLALDRAVGIMKRHHIKNALINIGGNVIALGGKGGKGWLIGIRDPHSSRAFAIIQLHDGEAIGTSGDYNRSFDYKGTRYCHVINPLSGYPPVGVESVTVLIGKGQRAGVESDVMSKPLFLSPSTEWLRMARSLGIKFAVRVYRGKYEMTSGLAKRAIFVDPKVSIVDLK
ncbi:FAD:protein FMN transferase [Candidatus Ichthyocystis hellenicum]|uniref:FAD:protein FMN transferase n=1 Tax=Candidatus Ichthyocystis hellenicum TaxID=1561003 RepID=UPI000AB4E97D|nr:FAD:protein FMN transferase [Candidatus Ichthyocystis hellenicum]